MFFNSSWKKLGSVIELSLDLVDLYFQVLVSRMKQLKMAEETELLIRKV